MNPLDNPVWSALTTAHAHLALGDGMARRYPREVTTISAFPEMKEIPNEAWKSMAELVAQRETIAVLFAEETKPPQGWDVVARVEIMQMVHDGKTVPGPAQAAGVESLSAANAAEIVELGKLTNPGPIGMRSHEIADFIGMRNEDGQLIAMAGERFRFPGHAEVSGVCTRPGFEGRGLAASLVVRVIERIQRRGERPFLHSRAENMRAIKLYERLGFVKSRSFPMAVLRKT